jgi:hypothetical protein
VPILNVGAAIAGAVANAIGKDVQELPLTPPRVLALILGKTQQLALPHAAFQRAGKSPAYPSKETAIA